MSFTEWQDEFNQAAHECFRRVYIKRRQATGYEAAWVQIPNDRIISFGSVAHQFEYADSIGIKTDAVTLKFKNDGGYFNDITDPASIFYNYMSRYKTLFKIEAGYIDKTGAEIGSPAVFMGIVLSDFAQSMTDITIKVNSLIDVYKLLPVKNVSGLYSGVVDASFTSSELIVHLCVNATDGAGNIILEPYISSNALNVDHVGAALHHNDYSFGGIPTEANYGNTVFDLLSKLTLVEDQVLYASPEGNITFARRNKTGNFHSSESAPSAPSELFMHTPFSGSPTSTVGPDWTWTGAAAYAAAKFSEGAYFTSSGGIVDLTGAAWPIATISSEYTVGAFNPDKFTVEFWLKTAYAVTNGDPNTGAYAEPMYWQYWGEADNYDHIEICATPIRLNKFGHRLTQASILASDVSWGAGDLVFLAFVHDKDGIEGSNDTFRVYFAPDGGAITMAAHTATSRAPIMGIPNAELHLFAGGVVPNRYPGDIIDNLKIYNYAKTDFSDRDTENGYMQPKFFDLVGQHDEAQLVANIFGSISFAPNVEKMRNWIQVKYLSEDTTTSIAEQQESWTVGDSSSSDLYGQKKLEAINYYMAASTAAERALQLYNEFKNPRIEVDIEAPFMPFLKPLDNVRLTYQTPGLASPTATGEGKAVNIDHKRFSIQKINHNLDKLSSKITLREVI